MKQVSIIAALVLTAPVFSSAEETSFIQKVVLADEELLDGMKNIFQELQSKKGLLQEISSSTQPLVDKWHHFQSLIEEVEKSVSSEVADFHAQYNERAAMNPNLLELARQKWDFLYKHAFNISEAPTLLLDDARKIEADISMKLTSSDFAKKIQDVMAGLENADVVQKEKALLAEVLSIKMSVIENYGFKGVEGYIQYERARLEHSFDSTLSEISSGVRQFFSSLGLKSK